MKDFNTKINEQIGDNFKRLNEGVEKLVTWQDNYKEQVEKMVEQFNLASQSIEKSKDSMVVISERLENIPDVTEKIQSILSASAFTDISKNDFFTKEFIVSKFSDRMGMRLSGPILKNNVSTNIRSEGIINGVIQVPPDGSPIIMLSDHGTIGGYPKIASVISADFDKVSQLPPGSQIKFKEMTLKDAENLLEQIVNENLLTPKGIHGFFPAKNVNDDIFVYDENKNHIETFYFLRQQMKKNDATPNRSLSDFIAPKEKNIQDYIGAFSVTSGKEVEMLAKTYRDDNDDYSCIPVSYTHLTLPTSDLV